MAASRKSRCLEAVGAAVDDCLGRHVHPGQTLTLALSGGVDSVVLLHACHTRGLPISAIHVHHGLSPNADHWSGFCRGLCAASQIELRIEYVSVNTAGPEGLEAAARRARHERLQAADSDWLLLAHHRRDRAETLLFNILRGAGVRGAGSMRERSGRLLRPLLAVDRDAILGYARAFDLRWVDDESNADVRHSRNYLRHQVLPVLEARFPAAVDRLASAASHFAEASDLLDELARLDLGMAVPGFPVAVDVLRGLPEPRARNALRLLLDRAGVGIPSEERLVEGLRQMLAAGPDRHPMVGFGERTLRRRGRLIELD